MSNNPILFNAALSGATGGLNNERWIVSADSATYVPLRNACVTFATAVDAAIPTDATITQQEGELLESICANILASRGTPGNADIIAPAIAAMFTLLRAQLEAVGGGGEAVPPLATALYVDADTTVPGASQTGFIGAPFDDLTSAYAAASVVFADISIMPTLLMSAGLYAGFEEEDGQTVILQGVPDYMSSAPARINTDLIGNATPWALSNLRITADIITTATALLRQCSITGSVTVPDVNIIDCDLIDEVSCHTASIDSAQITQLNVDTIFGARIIAKYSRLPVIAKIGEDAATSRIEAEWCTIGSIEGCDTALLNFCRVGNVFATGAVNINDCTFDNPGSVIDVGALTIDSQSYQKFISGGGTIELNGGALTFTDRPFMITLSVVVPAVAADGVGYVNTTLVGTAFENVFSINDPVQVNPQSDLVAAGAGGGFINARISAANTLRCAFNGALAGGAANFTVARVR